MDSIREQISQALYARVQTILTANGYNVNVGANAYRARSNYDEEELPALSLWCGVETTQRKYNNNLKTMVVDIEMFKSLESETLTNDAVANQMIADIQKCIGTYNATISGLIEGLQETNTEPVYPSEGSDIISVRVTYEVSYMLVKSDPYSQP